MKKATYFYSLKVPFGTICVLLLATYVAVSAAYVIATFVHSWYKTGKFKEGIAAFGESARKALSFPVLIVASVLNFVAGFLEIWYSALHDIFVQRPFNSFGEFFAWVAGADLEVWRDVNSSERKTKTAIGLVMFFIIMITSALAGNSWGNIFHSPALGIGVGIVWFIAFLSLDRAVLKWMDKNSGRKVVIARLIMVLGVGYLNTLFVSMEMYHDEITTQIQEDKQHEIAGISDSIAMVVKNYQGDRDQLQTDVDGANKAYLAWASDKQSKIDAQRALWIADQKLFMGEVAGHIGSGLKGWGDAAKADAKVAYDDSVALAGMISAFEAEQETSPEYQSLVAAKNRQSRRDQEILVEIDKNKAYLDQRKDVVTDRKQDGFGQRVDAMWVQAGKRPFTFGMTFIFFLMLESMPVLMKMMSGKGNYDAELKLRDEEFAATRQHQRTIEMLSKQYGYSETVQNMNINHLREEANRAALVNGLRQKSHEQFISGLDALQQQLADIDARISLFPEAEREQIRETFYKKAYADYQSSLN